MANRTYLFARPSATTGTTVADGPAATGLSEWSYAIPLVSRILVSVDARLCPSLIRRDEGDIAVAGRLAAGVDRLGHFLDRIEHPAIGPFRDEAMAFLRSRTSAGDDAVLECAEIFAMNDAPFAEQAARLLDDIGRLDAEIEATLATLNRAEPKTFWTRVFKPSRESVEAPLRDVGLGYWSGTLYRTPSDPDLPPESDDA